MYVLLFDVFKHLGKINKKLLSHLTDFGHWEGLSESVKKGKLVIKIFFYIKLNEVLQICEN